MTHEIIITKEYLRNNPNHVFVFGDNLKRRGKGGAAKLRDEPNVYGFITKKAPNNDIDSFYTKKEYDTVFNNELYQLILTANKNKDKTYLISKIGSGLANKWNIFEEIIEPRLIQWSGGYENIILLWR
jgi:lantibiotic modifying enzyme